MPGVAGFATHGTAAYSWWHHFLTGFVVPNSGAIGILVALAEFVIGVALCAGLFTRLAALASLGLLFTYVMSGTASVCGFYALFAIIVLATWRTSSWIGRGRCHSPPTANATTIITFRSVTGFVSSPTPTSTPPEHQRR